MNPTLDEFLALDPSEREARVADGRALDPAVAEILGVACVPSGQLLAEVIPIETKRLATAKARAALLGVELHDTQGDTGERVLIATKTAWAMTRAFEGPSALADVERWLDRMEGRPA
jgi:hypothetical protein